MNRTAGDAAANRTAGNSTDAWPFADAVGLGLDDAACEYVDDALVRFDEMGDRARDEIADPGSVIVPVAIVFASGLLLVAGARLFRIAAALAAAAFGFGVVYGFIRSSGRHVSCEAIILVSSLMGLLAAFAAGCVYNAGLFFVGATAMSALVHLVFSAFPDLHDVGDQPTLADKSFIYWGLIVVSFVVGGLVLRHHDKPVLEVLTSCIGGAGIAYALRSLTEIAGGDAPAYVFMIAGLAATACGIVAQRRIRLRRCGRSDSRSGREERAVRKDGTELVRS